MKKGKELCDLLVVFDKYVLIFFDREKNLDIGIQTTDGDVIKRWKRWKKSVIDKQIKTANGAERYIKRKGKMFTDAKCQNSIPIDIDYENLVIHKIIVANGAEQACAQASDKNVYGSLACNYTSCSDNRLEFVRNEKDQISPSYLINLDKNNIVHIFDGFNLPILLKELDTIIDFTSYLDIKVKAIQELDILCYCGEEDLLAHYLLNQHQIGDKKDYTGLMIGEGGMGRFY